MPKYRKKPVVVEAAQLTAEAFEVDYPWAGHIPGVVYYPKERHAKVTTIHGDQLVVEVGDWIITEPDGIHHYPCKPDIFEATYEPVGGDEP